MNYLRIALPIVISALLVSCGNGGGGEQDANTGGISFNLVWEAPASAAKPNSGKALFAPAPPDACNDYGIATISQRVQNGSGSTVASGDFSCFAHSAILNRVPSGSNYVLIIEGHLANNSIAWTGKSGYLSVTAGQTTAAGTIIMDYVGTDNTRPTVLVTTPGSFTINVPVTATITATFSEDMAVSSISETTFTLKQGAASVNGTVAYNKTNRTATLTPAANLAYSTSYTATITTGVKDMANINTVSNYAWSFTTEAPAGSAPAAPTGVAASPRDRQNTITWTASTGATSYNIYWSLTAGVTIASGTKITGATSPYPHTGLTNGTAYYYIVTAQNSFGESPASAPIVTATPAPTPVAGPWTTKASMPTARYAMGSAVLNNKIYVIGGNNASGTVATVEEYDPSTDTWTTKPNMPTARGPATAVVNYKIYVIGGGDIKTVEEYDPVVNTWTTKNPMPTMRQPYVAAVNNKIYAVGGYNTITGSLSTNEEYDPASNTWTVKTSMPTARNSTPVAAGNDKVYAIGGEYSPNSPLSTVEEYDPSTNTWATKANMPTARRGPATAVINNKIYVIGGSNTSSLTKVELYDPTTNTWTTKASMPTARGYLGLVVVNNKIYAIGGADGSSVLATVEEYDPLLDP